ncbi:disks large-associated protein 4 isoform X2 [Esox lucius]|uniref:Discs, large (Drosophila) homolog-associated protein 4a n=1 Tax=Esox lucius TaxID=8010 RepID=A0A3P8YRR9_ESOLU|nr:disks large-associated protein 4 isoform X2 [Esox lucius]
MKGLGANRSRNLSDSCEPSGGPQKPLYPLTSDPHGPFLLSPTINHYGTMEPHQLYHYPAPNPESLPPECLMPLNQMSNSSTFPRLHFTSQTEQTDYSQEYSQGCMVPTRGEGGHGASRAGTLSTSMSMSLGLGLSGAPMITSGSATISSAAAAKMNRLPSNLLDQLEKHLPLQRDGFSTLQFHRGRVAKQRSESPGRIRHIMHSVQRLFNKSQSLEGTAVKGNMNSSTGGAEDGTQQTRRSKSKDRAKTETLKHRPSRQNALGLWSSDDALDADTTNKAGAVAVGYRNPLSMMTLGRAVSDSQAPPRHLSQGYNTIAAHTLKSSKSSSDLKYLACPQALAGTKGGELEVGGGGRQSTLVKRGSWSTLTLSQARQVFQKGSATVNRTLLKSKSCHQDLTCQYLQVPLGDWSTTLGGRGRPGHLEIPCRRMRSGSYVKAMGEVDQDSEDSEGSPKPSPKTAARRQSYLKATHQSLSEQQAPSSHNCLPSLRELSTNRSLDNLDCLVSSGEPLMAMRHWEDGRDYHQGFGTLGRGMMTCGQVCGQGCGRSLYCEGESQAVEALDLPTPTCFRSRSHSYLRAIQAGCSQDEDTASVDSDTPPPTATSCTYTPCNSTCADSSYKTAPPPVPPRTTSKPYPSVTVQSSTESAQDTYLDQQDRRSEANSQSERSNSSDSLCSLRTSSLAKGPKPPAPAPVPAPRESHLPATSSSTTSSGTQFEPQNESLNPGPSLTPDQSLTLPEPVPTKRKLSSIGVQVDCVQPIQRDDQALPSTKFQSIGVQVVNGRPLSRASSMASRQNTETEAQDSQQDSPPPENNSRPNCNCNSQPLEHPSAASNGEGRGVTRQSPKHAPVPARAAPAESLDSALDPSSLPPPDPSLESGNGSVSADTAQPALHACLRDGNWFLKLLQAETARMEGWCQQMEQETKDKDISEEVMGTVRSAVGSAQLLIAQKFQQFRGLCEENLNVNAKPRPTAQDLAGFWDLLQLSVEDISVKFDELWQLKSNNWQLPEKKEKKAAPLSVPKKSSKPKLTAGKDQSMDSAVDKQRQEARKRLMAAKRAASVRQNSATESSDSIEIYVPEAQTRL